MSTQPTSAPFGSLNWNDLKKGIITAVLVGGVSAIFPMLSAPTIVIGTLAKAFGIGALSGFAGYILKNLGTNSNDQFLKKESVKMIAVLLISAFAFSSCGTMLPSVNATNTVTQINYSNNDICVDGYLLVKSPTIAEIDSTIAAWRNRLTVYVQPTDSAGKYKVSYHLCSPPLK